MLASISKATEYIQNLNHNTAENNSENYYYNGFTVRLVLFVWFIFCFRYFFSSNISTLELLRECFLPFAFCVCKCVSRSTIAYLCICVCFMFYVAFVFASNHNNNACFNVCLFLFLSSFVWSESNNKIKFLFIHFIFFPSQFVV